MIVFLSIFGTRLSVIAQSIMSQRFCFLSELYLEELSYNIELSHIECQTDPLLDRPATPLFIPAKSGKDVATQIEDGEVGALELKMYLKSNIYIFYTLIPLYVPQLFDFDKEVQPLLEVLIGKTIEQSLLEVMEEEELACLRAQQRAFQELRNAELAEVQRLQEQERRRREEKVGKTASRGKRYFIFDSLGRKTSLSRSVAAFKNGFQPDNLKPYPASFRSLPTPTHLIQTISLLAIELN